MRRYAADFDGQATKPTACRRKLVAPWSRVQSPFVAHTSFSIKNRKSQIKNGFDSPSHIEWPVRPDHPPLRFNCQILNLKFLF
jgi:hypothetical protein